MAGKFHILPYCTHIFTKQITGHALQQLDRCDNRSKLYPKAEHVKTLVWHAAFTCSLLLVTYSPFWQPQGGTVASPATTFL